MLLILKLIELEKIKLSEYKFVAQCQKLKKDKDVVIMGQDIAEYGGVFKATKGFVEKFGKNRVRNTPITESAVIGTAMGLSIDGF